MRKETMMTKELTRAEEASLGRDVLHAIRYYLAGRRAIVVLAATMIIAGLALSWNWLTAVGLAPLLIGVLPCVAMCALGLCMSRMTGRSCSSEDVPPKAVEGSDVQRNAPVKQEADA
jgi:hypothetical protein